MPNFFHNYPYTDFHELNLDWCIENIQKLLTYFEGLSKLATVEYVDTEIAKAKTACEALIADLEERKLDKTTFDTFVAVGETEALIVALVVVIFVTPVFVIVYAGGIVSPSPTPLILTPY